LAPTKTKTTQQKTKYTGYWIGDLDRDYGL